LFLLRKKEELAFLCGRGAEMKGDKEKKKKQNSKQAKNFMFVKLGQSNILFFEGGYLVQKFFPLVKSKEVRFLKRIFEKEWEGKK
jgi:hypothetical protein